MKQISTDLNWTFSCSHIALWSHCLQFANSYSKVPLIWLDAKAMNMEQWLDCPIRQLKITSVCKDRDTLSP